MKRDGKGNWQKKQLQRNQIKEQFFDIYFGNWAFVNGVNGQLNGFGGVGTFCSDFEPDCGGFRRYCFLQSIAEACLWSCGICGGFGGIGGGGIGGPFGKK
ncbi:hypothetical protein niasHT_023287 [Heterodera trifolii]|uniref:Uncharacterized protein n=1 Tax=Heterodera trifolii TaxID=157864 RepID=A0ABD2JDH1_9BILA